MRDIVTRLDPRAETRAVFGRRDYLDRAVFHRDCQAKTAVIAVGLDTHLIEIARIEIG